MKSWALVALAASFLLSACQAPGGGMMGGMQSASPSSSSRVLRVGDPAPDFTLPDQNRQNVTLSQFRGRTVQLAFYVWAFSGG